jgi:hypothetical protein
MATNNNVDIAVYVISDQKDNKNILSFIVQDEYHLKKLTVGAYNLNILETQLLSNLSSVHCNVIACGDYVVVFNVTDSNRLNAILFNAKPTILKKGSCLFKIEHRIGCGDTADSNVKQISNKMPTSELHNNFSAPNISSVSPNDVTKTNSDLFLATFGNNENGLNRNTAVAADESTTDTDNGDDDDDDDKLSDEPVAAKRQKLDHSE